MPRLEAGRWWDSELGLKNRQPLDRSLGQKAEEWGEWGMGRMGKVLRLRVRLAGEGPESVEGLISQPRTWGQWPWILIP